MVLLKLSGQREVNIIVSEFILGITIEELIALYEYVTKEKFSSQLVIDMKESADKRFGSGLIEILDIHR